MTSMEIVAIKAKSTQNLQARHTSISPQKTMDQCLMTDACLLNRTLVAFTTECLRKLDPPYWPFRGGPGGESEFISRLVGCSGSLQVLCEDAKYCYVWHDDCVARSPSAIDILDNSSVSYGQDPIIKVDPFVIIDKIDWQAMDVSDVEAVLPKLGINNENLEEMPPELHNYFGHGVLSWQYPIQLAKFINFIKFFSISSYVEIGTRWGGTFVIIDSVLRRVNPTLISYAVDLMDQPPSITEYAKKSNVCYIKGDSHKEETWKLLPTQADMVFIDGDHSFEAVKNDFFNALSLRPRLVIFHDTASDVCPGVTRFWNIAKELFPFYKEFHEQYASVQGSYLGIGVLILDKLLCDEMN